MLFPIEDVTNVNSVQMLSSDHFLSSLQSITSNYQAYPPFSGVSISSPHRTSRGIFSNCKVMNVHEILKLFEPFSEKDIFTLIQCALRLTDPISVSIKYEVTSLEKRDNLSARVKQLFPFVMNAFFKEQSFTIETVLNFINHIHNCLFVLPLNGKIDDCLMNIHHSSKTRRNNCKRKKYASIWELALSANIQFPIYYTFLDAIFSSKSMYGFTCHVLFFSIVI